MSLSPSLVTVTASVSTRRLATFYSHIEGFGTRPPLERALVVAFQTLGAQDGMSPDALQIRQGAVLASLEYRPPVQAFAEATDAALRFYPEAPIFACLHDDCLIETKGWDEKVLEYFEHHPQCGLLGFGGAWGLGDPAIANPDEPYRADLLVRRGFMSNMHDAEVHGSRVTEPRRVAVLDGFSLIFRREFLEGRDTRPLTAGCHSRRRGRLAGLHVWQYLADLGLRHHAYDAAMGILAKLRDWEVHLLPLACRHLGGQTAVGDSGYARWALTQHPQGDAGFHDEAHRIVWEWWRETLPIVVDPPEGI